MSKPVLVFQAPVGTRSGYGERSRDLVRALIALDKYDIKIISTRWGSTPMNALTDQDEDIVSRFLLHPLTQQPEIYMQVTVPNEFQRIGKFNIGVTAGIETTLCDASWIEGCNRMDLILASSNHAKSVFEASTYEKRDSATNQLLGTLKLEKPVEVLFEGVRLDKFKRGYSNKPVIEDLMNQVQENFAFLFVGHWLQGAFGEDRKNVSGLIKTFFEAFKNKSDAPALILKTSIIGPAVVDREEIKKRIEEIKSSMDTKNLPNVYLITADLTDEEMSDLYNHEKVKTHISFTKGEGYGRPLAEAALTGKPIIVSGWSGHSDFLDSKSSILVSGELKNVHPSAVWQGVINPDAQWFNINYNEALAYMKDVFQNYKSYAERSRKTFHHIKTNFSFDAMQSKLKSILDARVPDFPRQISLNLPKLKKIELPKLTKIESTENQ